ncbi:putative AB hydrolase-1 domain-containing protein [Seiridium unicorne]|uniref:AB hydrolase-1 domain-containing protein n=1 Tax=Seiridium unicorne TaxID=138068 RepID=A0ABR2UJ98_9PEZI
MATTKRTSLSKSGLKPSNEKPSAITDYDGLAQVPRISKLPSKIRKQVIVEPLNIQVEDGPEGCVAGFLHMPRDFVSPAPQEHHRTAAILLSGAGGGVVGPSSIYLSLAAKLAALGSGIPVLRLDYRYPARNQYCVADVKTAISYLQDTYGLDRFVLVGWSFGGAPVFTVGGSDDRIIGCATVASQTAETEGIRRLAPTPVLLLHGTGDKTLSVSCSQRLYDMYGENGNRHIHLFEGDNHALSSNAKTAEAMLLDFIVGCAGLRVNDAEMKAVAQQTLVGDGEREELMKKGGDLRSPECAS